MNAQRLKSAASRGAPVQAADPPTRLVYAADIGSPDVQLFADARSLRAINELQSQLEAFPPDAPKPINQAIEFIVEAANTAQSVALKCVLSHSPATARGVAEILKALARNPDEEAGDALLRLAACPALQGELS